MSLIILRECSMGILYGDLDLWLDTISDVTITNTVERTLIPRKNLFNQKSTQAIIHKNNDKTTGTFTCYLTDKFKESILFNLLGCSVYANGFVVPDIVVKPEQYTPAKFVIASPYNAYEVNDVLITSITFPLGKGFAGEMQVSFEGGELVQTPRSFTHIFNKSQDSHIKLSPLEFIFDEIPYSAISANINIAQNITWVDSKSIYDTFNRKRPVVTGHNVNITTSQYHRNESILPSFENIMIKQGQFQLTMEQASITRRLGLEEDIITLSCDIQPSSHMPIIQII